MKNFKFFQKGTLDMMDGDVRSTASLHNPFNNNEMERYYYDRQLGRFETVRPTLNQEEVTRRINGGGTDIRLFQTTTVTTVNPKWWMKIKMFFQKIKINAVIETHSEAMGIFFIAVTVTFIFGLMIAKVLNVW